MITYSLLIDLIYTHLSILIEEKSSFKTTWSNFSCHCLWACFKPYKDFLNLQTLFFYLGTIQPSGCNIYISSFRSAFRKTFLTSIWCIKRLWIETKVIKTQIEEILVTSENISKKSIFYFRVKPFTTNLALYLSIEPSGKYFLLNFICNQ
jgi:hypothetical protein